MVISHVQQEPGANDNEILSGIRHVRPGSNFQPNITLFRKIEVNGIREHPLYSYLKVIVCCSITNKTKLTLSSFDDVTKQKSCPATRDFFAPPNKLDYGPYRVSDVRWNFEKFLVDRNGKPVKRYDPSARVSDMRADIEALVAKSRS